MAKKMGVLWVLLVVLSVVTWVTYAGGSQRDLGPEWQAVLSEFNLRPAASIPVGIHPLQINSPEELSMFIQRLQRASRGCHSFVVTWNPNLRKSGTASLHLESTETYVPLHKQECIDWVYHVFLNLWANVWVAGSGSFWEITDVNQWVGLTGVTAFYSLSDVYSYHHIYSDRQSVYIYGRSTVDYYLFIKGLLKIYSFPVSLSITFNIR